MNKSLPLWALGYVLGMAGMCLLSGCGDDRAADGSQASPGSGYAVPAQAAPTSVSQTGASDPLLSGSGAIPTADPLLSGDPLSRQDPLAQSDPLKGRTMPTDHSHWLRGRVQDARLTVLLNGIRQGVYTGVVDQDITMKLRAGINTVSFLYEPSASGSSAQMDLVESEHNPPISPLASFQSTPPADGASDFKPTTQTATFFAK